MRDKKKKKPARLKTQKGDLGKSQGQRKKKEKKLARLKTQKGGLDKSQGQRKEEEEEEEEEIGRSYQVGNLKMQPKKIIILQDESLEVWFKRNELKNNC